MRVITEEQIQELDKEFLSVAEHVFIARRLRPLLHELVLPVPPAEQPDARPHTPGTDVSPNITEDSHRPDILII